MSDLDQLIGSVPLSQWLMMFVVAMVVLVLTNIIIVFTLLGMTLKLGDMKQILIEAHPVINESDTDANGISEDTTSSQSEK